MRLPAPKVPDVPGVANERRPASLQSHHCVIDPDWKEDGGTLLAWLCRKIAFSRQNPKIVHWKISGLRVQTFLFSVIYDRASADSSTRERGVVRLEDQGRQGHSPIGLSCLCRRWLCVRTYECCH